MLDLESCRKEFKEYVDNYDMSNAKIYLKYCHTLRVIEFCGKIAQSLNLSEEDRKISMLIGLLHDIGRFEQLRVYDTFIDKDSIDHANYGIEILTNKNFINKFVTDKDLQRLVITAIKNHNKYSIEDGLDERTLMFCKLIRDADKLDIFNIFINNDLKIEKTDSLISDKIYNQLMDKKALIDKDMKTEFDYFLRQVGMFFDLNYKYSLDYVKENKLVDKLIDIIIEENEHETKKLINIKNKLYEFLDSK